MPEAVPEAVPEAGNRRRLVHPCLCACYRAVLSGTDPFFLVPVLGREALGHLPKEL